MCHFHLTTVQLRCNALPIKPITIERIAAAATRVKRMLRMKIAQIINIHATLAVAVVNNVESAKRLNISTRIHAMHTCCTDAFDENALVVEAGGVPR